MCSQNSHVPMSTNADAAMAFPSPMTPIPSVVVAVTLTAPAPMLMVRARDSRMSGMNRASLGRSAMITAETYEISIRRRYAYRSHGP